MRSYKTVECSTLILSFIVIVLILVIHYHSNSFYSPQTDISQLESLNTHNMSDLKRLNPDKIIFLKTFKTGGSTLSNLLHNYCVKHNKSCIIGHSFWARREFRKIGESISWKTRKNEKTYDMFSDHVLFNPVLYSIIPNTSEQCLTIVRYPLQQFMSAWNHCMGHFHWSVNISTFINMAKSNIVKYSTSHPRWSLNSMCRVLIPGFVENGIDKYNNLKKIKNGKWLVLILERFDESLLVMKYAYNLKWTDLVYIKMKTNKKNLKLGDEYLDNEQDKQKLLQLSYCDLKLYNIAYKQFENRLFEIYSGNNTKIQQDIKTMNNVIQHEIDKCKDIDNDSYYCQSIYKDHSEWLYWARNIKTS